MIARALVLVAIAAGSAAAAPGAQTVAANVEAHYRRAPFLRAHVRREETSKTFGRTVVEGTMLAARPDQLRWDEPGRSFIKPRAVPTAAIVAFMGKASLRKDFALSLDTSGTYGSPGDLVLVLSPPQPGPDRERQIIWVVDAGDYHVKEAIATYDDGDDQTVRLVFTAISDAPIPAARFTAPRATP